MTYKHLVVAVAVQALLLSSLTGCGEKKQGVENSPVSTLIKIEPQQAMNALQPGNAIVSNVEFGGKFLLLGAVAKAEKEGIVVDFYWKSLEKQRLKYTNFVHFLDEKDQIIGQADHAQDAAQVEVQEGTVWLDSIQIPAAQYAHKAKRLGAGLYIAPDGATMLPTKMGRGEADWDGKRLLVPLAWQ